MSSRYQPTLRNRLIARRNHKTAPDPPLAVPQSGLIGTDTLMQIEVMAQRAKTGDREARDWLYASLERRLHRKGYLLRPWPNTPQCTGIWDRDDVRQESWLIFVELLQAWDEQMPFVPYLFARFPWRLRDRILRGIGKPLPWAGAVRVPDDLLQELLSAHDSDQPESALLAARLFEYLVGRSMSGEVASVDPRTLLMLLHSPRFQTMRGDVTEPDDDHPFSQIEAA